MANHYHLIVHASEDWRGDRILSDFKAYATRKLSAAFGAPPSKTWWTAKGSKRQLQGDHAIESGVNYVLHKQPHPLVVWSKEKGRLI
jgi:hypothetical protein